MKKSIAAKLDESLANRLDEFKREFNTTTTETITKALEAFLKEYAKKPVAANNEVDSRYIGNEFQKLENIRIFIMEQAYVKKCNAYCIKFTTQFDCEKISKYCYFFSKEEIKELHTGVYANASFIITKNRYLYGRFQSAIKDLIITVDSKPVTVS